MSRLMFGDSISMEWLPMTNFFFKGKLKFLNFKLKKLKLQTSGS